LKEGLPQKLRELRELLDEACPAIAGLPRATRAVVARCADRLDRDLLPRTAGAHDHLVAGIVGPNNAGKSALFNALVGEALSPSEPTGGATRRLVGVCHPELAAHLRSEPTLARFPLRSMGAAQGGLREALVETDRTAQLLLVERAGLPADVLLIDAPDFDSILVANRRASEALLKVADLALVVVTRHTYQNRDVVDFLKTWLAHGRPWALVYNESLGTEVTREHAAKLAADLGSAPVAVFQAPFDIGVQRGESWLEPVELDGDTPLREWLFHLGNAPGLKARALASSLDGLDGDLDELRAALADEARLAADLAAAASDRAARLGREVAGKAMPMAPFLDAFRAVLDRRPSLIQRGFRGALRTSRLFLEAALARLPFGSRPRRVGEAETDLARVEGKALGPAWPAYFEDLCLELGPGGAFWKHHGAPDDELRRRLEADLAPGRSEAARERALATLGADPEVMRAFQDACEDLIESELVERGYEWVWQLAVDTLHLLPVVTAGIVIFKTAGLGADVAVAGAGTLSTLVAEKMSRLLGSEVARGARARWTKLRGARLARVMYEAALAETHVELAARQARHDELGEVLRGLQEELR